MDFCAHFVEFLKSEKNVKYIFSNTGEQYEMQVNFG